MMRQAGIDIDFCGVRGVMGARDEVGTGRDGVDMVYSRLWASWGWGGGL